MGRGEAATSLSEWDHIYDHFPKTTEKQALVFWSDKSYPDLSFPLKRQTNHSWKWTTEKIWVWLLCKITIKKEENVEQNSPFINNEDVQEMYTQKKIITVTLYFKTI